MSQESLYCFLADLKFPVPSPTVEDLWAECIKHTADGDLHLESLHGAFQATSCAGDDCKNEDIPWYHGDTAKEALAKLWFFLYGCKKPLTFFNR